MEELSGASYSMHAAKCWKKNKGKRLVRSIAKKNRAKERRDNATVALYMVGDEEEDEEEILERKRESEERLERNRKWREKKKQKQTGEEAPKVKNKIDKNARNRMIDKELRCKNCRDNLDSEVWQCANGHGFCADCVDKSSIQDGEREGEMEMGDDGVFRNKDFHDLRRIINNESNEDTFCAANMREIDEESEKTGENEEEDTLWKFKKKDEEEESLPTYEESIDLNPKTLSQIELEEHEEDEEIIKEKYNNEVKKNINNMEFFEADTNIRKDTIGAYGDYNRDYKNIFESYSIDEEEWNKEYQLDEDDRDDDSNTDSSSSAFSSSYSTDTELEINPVSQCPVCNLSIKERNLELENIAVIFNKMMEHRMKI